jgi:HrpA-like RNA helicase
MIKKNTCCIVIGGTGTDKTICVPQWTYYHVYFEEAKPEARVAVLVPRRAIAEGLSKYISTTRKVSGGEEVGHGDATACIPKHT